MKSIGFPVTLSADDTPLLEHVRAPVLVWHWTTRNVLYVNDALCCQFDAMKSDFEGRDVVTLLAPDCRKTLGCWLNTPSRISGDQIVLDIRLAPVGRRPRWMNGTFVLTEWDGERAVAGFLQDIEDRQQRWNVEQRLMQSREMESLGRMAGGIAHDMNNTLGAIMGFASVLQTEMNASSSGAQDVAQILKACRKGRDLMLNLLGFARKGKFRGECFSVGSLVQHALALLEHSVSRKISLERQFSAEHLEVYGDSDQIRHAIMNLCFNAIDSMGDNTGCLTVGVSTEYVATSFDSASDFCELEKGEYVTIQVSDTGKGMSPEVAAMAFEPYYTTKPPGEGSGMGLSMVYGTVRNHGGDVLMESRVGKGTTVTILLPRTDSASRKATYGIERKTPSNGQIATILLVDDEEMIRLSGKRVLEKMGYRVLLARDGADAVRVFAEQADRIALIILDLMMPVMDGFEAFQRLREISDDIPVLLSSGYSKEEKAEQLLASGANAFLQKPFEMNALREKLQHLLNTELLE